MIPGAVRWRCERCGKTLVLEGSDYAAQYRGQALCLDCRQQDGDPKR